MKTFVPGISSYKFYQFASDTLLQLSNSERSYIIHVVTTTCCELTGPSRFEASGKLLGHCTLVPSRMVKFLYQSTAVKADSILWRNAEPWVIEPISCHSTTLKIEF